MPSIFVAIDLLPPAFLKTLEIRALSTSDMTVEYKSLTAKISFCIIKKSSKTFPMFVDILGFMMELVKMLEYMKNSLSNYVLMFNETYLF